MGCCNHTLPQDYGTIPKNVLELSVENFKRELRALRRSVRYDELSEVWLFVRKLLADVQVLLLVSAGYLL